MSAFCKLVLGGGYLGERVARRWQQAGHRVVVTTRRAERARVLEAAGFEALVLDITKPTSLESLTRIGAIDTLLFAVAYDPRAGTSRERQTVGGLMNSLNAIRRLNGRFIYISTTGVYGQSDGEWVDEQSECYPQRDAGIQYLEAEQQLLTHRWGQQSVVLRMAGIYGPGRVPFLDQLRTGAPIPVDRNGYLNLIHVDDAALVVVAAERTPSPDVFLVSDGQPVRREEYYRNVGRLVGREPVFTPPDPQSPRSARARSNKRIKNSKLRTRLNVQLAYPDYRAGLVSILGAGGPNSQGSPEHG